MNRKVGGCFSLIATLGVSASPAMASDVDPFALSPEQLFDAEVVSASRTLENVWDASAAIYVVSTADIERAGVTSIPEALRLVPGVQVARINSAGWAVSVRGFNSPLANKLLVLIDGREIYDPLFSGVYWDVQDTVLEDIDRIEVIRGPGASLWGANAVNGVINIITKPAAETQGALVSATAGAEERGAITARYGGSIADRGHWRLYGRGFDRAGQETLKGADDNSAWQALRAGFRMDLDLDARNALTVQGDAYRSETGQLRGVPTLTAPYSVVARESIDADGGNILARWTREAENGGRLTAQAFLDRTTRDQLPLEYRRTTFDVDTQYELPKLGWHNFVAGVRYRQTHDEITPTQIITSASSTHSEDSLSVFAQDQITLPKSWRLTIGSKFEDNDYTGLEVQPTARLQWNGKDAMIWGSASRAVRSPSELEREFNVVTGVIPPNPIIPVPVSVELQPNRDFESEVLLAYEVGVRKRWSSVELDVTAFHNEYDGLEALSLQTPRFALNPLHVVLPIAATNSTAAWTDGLETTLAWRVDQDFRIALNYSLLSMSLHGPPAAVAIASQVAETQFPRKQGNVRFQWDVTDRFALDSTFYYMDELPGYGVKSYVRSDLRVAYRLADHLQIEVIGQDLFDQSHREFGSPTDANAANIQRSIFGRLTWRS
jgi:iron complex outermembrane receptor protein